MWQGVGAGRTVKAPVLAVVQRPAESEAGASSREARARVVADVSEHEARRVLGASVAVAAHLISDECKAFASVGQASAAHDTVRHGRRAQSREGRSSAFARWASRAFWNTGKLL